MKHSTSSDPPLSGNTKKAAPTRHQEFLPRYTKEPGIVESDLGKSYAHCRYCRMDFSIARSGQFDISRHCKSKTHAEHVKVKNAAVGSQDITKFMPTQRIMPSEQAVIRAEAMFTELIVKMNLPLSTADVVSKTVKSAFPDSRVAADYQWCCRNKTTAITILSNQVCLTVKSQFKLVVQRHEYSAS